MRSMIYFFLLMSTTISLFSMELSHNTKSPFPINLDCMRIIYRYALLPNKEVSKEERESELIRNFSRITSINTYSRNIVREDKDLIYATAMEYLKGVTWSLKKVTKEKYARKLFAFLTRLNTRYVPNSLFVSQSGENPFLSWGRALSGDNSFEISKKPSSSFLKRVVLNVSAYYGAEITCATMLDGILVEYKDDHDKVKSICHSAMEEAILAGNVHIIDLLQDGKGIWVPKKLVQLSFCDANSKQDKRMQNKEALIASIIKYHKVWFSSLTTFLLQAAIVKDYQAVQILINLGADINRHGKDHRNLLGFALSKLDIDLLKILLKNKIRINEPCDLTNFYGASGVWLTIELLYGRSNINEKACLMEILQLLIDAGGNVNQPAVRCGCVIMPLTYAKICKLDEVVKVLEKAGARENSIPILLSNQPEILEFSSDN